MAAATRITSSTTTRRTARQYRRRVRRGRDETEDRHRRRPGHPRARKTRLLDTLSGDKHAWHLQNRVRERRVAKGLSQRELAGQLAVSRQTINSIEVGRYIPSLPLAMRIARFFGTTVEEMFDDEA